MVESRIVEGVYKRFSVPHDNVDESNYYIPPIVRPTKFFYRELKETEKKDGQESKLYCSDFCYSIYQEVHLR